MLNIYSQAQQKITTDKFLSLSIEKQRVLLNELYKTIITGLRYIVISNTNAEYKDEFERIMDKQDDGSLFLFGRKYVKDFDNKLQKMIDQVTEAFIYDIEHGKS